jgi:acyl-CoA thioester hydrolase
MRRENHGMAAVQQNITYKREMLPGDIVEVRSGVLELGEKSVGFVHEMRNGKTDEVAALCELTGVHMDRLARTAIAFPSGVPEKTAAVMPRV